MAKSNETKLVWTTVDVSNNAKLAPLYQNILKARAALKDAQAKFEPELKVLLAAKNLAVETADSEVIVGYNFGQLSYAQRPKAMGTKAAKVSL